MTMHLVLHHGDDMGTLNVSKRGRRLTSTEDSIDASIQRLEEDIKSAEDNWFQRPETIQTTHASTEEK